MTAKAVRGLAKGIGGMTAAGVAAATFMGDGDAVASKKAGEAASTHVRRIIKRRMLNLDSFNRSTITVSADDLEGDTADDSADDLEGDSADASDDDGAIDLANDDGAIDLADDDVDCENDDCDDD